VCYSNRKADNLRVGSQSERIPSRNTYPASLQILIVILVGEAIEHRSLCRQFLRTGKHLHCYNRLYMWPKRARRFRDLGNELRTLVIGVCVGEGEGCRLRLQIEHSPCLFPAQMAQGRGKSCETFLEIECICLLVSLFSTSGTAMRPFQAMLFFIW
jgi:hypothetical protein